MLTFPPESRDVMRTVDCLQSSIHVIECVYNLLFIMEDTRVLKAPSLRKIVFVTVQQTIFTESFLYYSI